MMLKYGKKIFLFALLLNKRLDDANIKEHDKIKKDCRGRKKCFIKPFFWQRNLLNSGEILNFRAGGVS